MNDVKNIKIKYKNEINYLAKKLNDFVVSVDGE